MTRHTIILSEATAGSRAYDQYPTIRHAMNGICLMFEKRLKSKHPNQTQITYDIKQLNDYIDQMPDLAALTLSEREGMYLPHNKEWIKEEVLSHLTKQANE